MNLVREVGIKIQEYWTHTGVDESGVLFSRMGMAWTIEEEGKGAEAGW